MQIVKQDGPLGFYKVRNPVCCDRVWLKVHKSDR